MAAGLWRSHAASMGVVPSLPKRHASFAADVVFPEPCSPTSRITVGPSAAVASVGRPSPSRRASSSCTIFTICCPGETAFSTASPRARSCTRARKSRVTWKLTSASRSTRRTSLSPSLIMGSVSTPRCRSFLSAPSSFLLSSSNIERESSHRHHNPGRGFRDRLRAYKLTAPQHRQRSPPVRSPGDTGSAAACGYS